MREVVARARPKFSLDSVPLEDYFQLLEEHFLLSDQVALHSKGLRATTDSFLAVERRLVGKFKERTISDLSSLQTLLEQCYGRIIAKSEQLQKAKSALAVIEHRLRLAGETVRLMVGLKAGSGANQDLLKSVLQPECDNWRALVSRVGDFLTGVPGVQSLDRIKRIQMLAIRKTLDGANAIQHRVHIPDNPPRFCTDLQLALHPEYQPCEPDPALLSTIRAQEELIRELTLRLEGARSDSVLQVTRVLRVPEEVVHQTVKVVTRVEEVLRPVGLSCSTHESTDQLIEAQAESQVRIQELEEELHEMRLQRQQDQALHARLGDLLEENHKLRVKTEQLECGVSQEEGHNVDSFILGLEKDRLLQVYEQKSNQLATIKAALLKLGSFPTVSRIDRLALTKFQSLRREGRIESEPSAGERLRQILRKAKRRESEGVSVEKELASSLQLELNIEQGKVIELQEDKRRLQQRIQFYIEQHESTVRSGLYTPREMFSPRERQSSPRVHELNEQDAMLARAREVDLAYHYQGLFGEVSAQEQLRLLRETVIGQQSQNKKLRAQLNRLRREQEEPESEASAAEPTTRDSFAAQLAAQREQNLRLRERVDELVELVSRKEDSCWRQGGTGTLFSQFGKSFGERLSLDQLTTKLDDWDAQDKELLERVWRSTPFDQFVLLRDAYKQKRRMSQQLDALNCSLRLLPISLRKNLIDESLDSVLVELKQVGKSAELLKHLSEEQDRLLAQLSQEDLQYQTVVQDFQGCEHAVDCQTERAFAGLERAVEETKEKCCDFSGSALVSRLQSLLGEDEPQLSQFAEVYRLASQLQFARQDGSQKFKSISLQPMVGSQAVLAQEDEVVGRVRPSVRTWDEDKEAREEDIMVREVPQGTGAADSEKKGEERSQHSNSRKMMMRKSTRSLKFKKS